MTPIRWFLDPDSEPFANLVSQCHLESRGMDTENHRLQPQTADRCWMMGSGLHREHGLHKTYGSELHRVKRKFSKSPSGLIISYS